MLILVNQQSFSLIVTVIPFLTSHRSLNAQLISYWYVTYFTSICVKSTNSNC